MSIHRTLLTEAEFLRALNEVKRHLRQEQSIRNTSLRDLTGLNYDQVIKFFNRAIEEGVLERRGKGSGTHYVLAPPERENT